jgi:hypothetical protein
MRCVRADTLNKGMPRRRRELSRVTGAIAQLIVDDRSIDPVIGAIGDGRLARRLVDPGLGTDLAN